MAHLHTSLPWLLLLSAAAAAIMHAAAQPHLPPDIGQWVYTPQGFKDKNQNPMQRFWDRSILEQAHIVENLEQFHPLLRKLNAGQPITVVALGDSITANHGGCFHRDEEHRKRHVTLVDPQQMKGACNGMPLLWLSSFMQQVNATWPHPDHLLVNLAKPGSFLSTWSQGECLEEFFPTNVDLVVIEHLPFLEPVNVTVKEAERVLHRLWLHLQGPLPAIIFLNMHPVLPPAIDWGQGSAPDKCIRNNLLCPTDCPTYFQDKPEPSSLYSESELHTHAVASYYGLTSLSHPALMHALIRDRVPQNMMGLSECQAFGLLYVDAVHPDMHGRLIMADLLVNVLSLAEHHLAASAAMQTPGQQLLTRSLPSKPMEPESVTLYRSHCLYSAAKPGVEVGGGEDVSLRTMHMVKTEGWSFVEYDGEAKKYKPGWVATTPDSALWIDVPLSLLVDSSAHGRRSALETAQGRSEQQSSMTEAGKWHMQQVARKLSAKTAGWQPTPETAQVWATQPTERTDGWQEWAVLGSRKLASNRNRKVQGAPVGLHFNMHLSYLKSYRHMGKAKITCLEACMCTHEINSHNSYFKNSIPEIAFIDVFVHQAAGRCIVEVKVLNETESGEHKVKVLQLAIGTYLNMTEQLKAVTTASRHSSMSS